MMNLRTMWAPLGAIVLSTSFLAACQEERSQGVANRLEQNFTTPATTAPLGDQPSSEPIDCTVAGAENLEECKVRGSEDSGHNY